MSAALQDEQQQDVRAWRDLLDSPGWTRLVAHARAEWDGPVFATHVEQVADNPEDLMALAKLRQLLAAKRAVERLLATPAEQIAKAERLGAVTTFDGRRGRL